MNKPICLICEKPLESGEMLLCTSCHVFFEWKYGTKEKQQKICEVEEE